MGQHQGDIWDSGKVASNATNQIEYKGNDLASKANYFWKVKVWDEKGQESEWSTPASFSMGLLNFSDWKGLFIGHDVDTIKRINMTASIYHRPGTFVNPSLLRKKSKGLPHSPLPLGYMNCALMGRK